ncbi:uncharacterized protein LOC110177208 [Drosophila serrata]|uniref:uncharacterized protein LOC110177208 n=1 Tax=Drosophila serrata TaxID=7274 RepID=UPI000A1D093A|nr:uncharacterized protein LOC110177208 [Drosophila serrata]
MTKPLGIKGKTKNSRKRLDRPQRNLKLEIDGLIKQLKTLKKFGCQKNRSLYFGDNSSVKHVDDAEFFKQIHRRWQMADGPVSEGLLENCHRLAEKFETQKINKRADNGVLVDKVVSDENILKNGPCFSKTFSTFKVNKISLPIPEEDYMWMNSSCGSINVDEDKIEEFVKACQLSAKKIAVSNIFKDPRSDGLSENKSEPILSKKNICIDLIGGIYDNVSKPLGECKSKPTEKTTDKIQIVPQLLEKQAVKVQIVPKPLKKNAEKIDIFPKEIEKKTKKINIAYGTADKTQENPQKVSKPAEKMKDKLDIVLESLDNQLRKLQIVPRARKRNQTKLKVWKPQEKETEILQVDSKALKNKTVKVQIVPKPLKKNAEKIDKFPKQLEKQTKKINIAYGSAEKSQKVARTPQEKKAEILQVGSKPLEDKAVKVQVVSKPLKKNPEKIDIVSMLLQKINISYETAENTLENLQKVPIPAEKTRENLDIISELLKNQTTNLQIVPKALEKKKRIVLKTLAKSTAILEICSKPLKNRAVKPLIVPKALQKNSPKFKIFIDPEEKNLKKLEIVSQPMKKTQRKLKKQLNTTKIVSKQQEEGTLGVTDLQYSLAEMKIIGKYNSNIFNPSAQSDDPEESKQNKRNIIVDGSNVAYAHKRGTYFSSEGLQYCLQYFETMGHDVKAVVPLFRRNAFQSSNPQLLDGLYMTGKVVFTPCKNIPGQKSISYDDRFILQLAYEWNAAVISNDNYRDLIDESPAFQKIVETRVLGYTWCEDMFILPKDPYGRWGPTLDNILYN